MRGELQIHSCVTCQACYGNGVRWFVPPGVHSPSTLATSMVITYDDVRPTAVQCFECQGAGSITYTQLLRKLDHDRTQDHSPEA